MTVKIPQNTLEKAQSEGVRWRVSYGKFFYKRNVSIPSHSNLTEQNKYQ